MAKVNYDSDFCGNLPLHLINSIQPYGGLLLLDVTQFQVIQASENLEQILGISSSNILGKHLEDVLGSFSYNDIKAKIEESSYNNHGTGRFAMTNLNKDILFYIHRKEKYIVMELEPVQNSASDFTEIFHAMRYSTSTIKNATSVVALCQLAAKEIKKISGFDKVMIYRFDEDWNGNVLAEEKEEDMDSYMGLTFPASDIPRQARALYLKNPYRFIPDRTYEPVKLQPILNPINFTYSDLSDCNLRGVAPVHLEYLGNMKVVASMSTAIIKDNKLWGLIACHHKTVKVPDFGIRSAFEIISNIISSHILAIENQEKLEGREEKDKLQDGLFKNIARTANLAEGLLLSGQNLLQLFDATGMAFTSGADLRSIGEVPGKAMIDDLILWLSTNKTDEVYAKDSFESLLQVSNEKDKVFSGFLAIPINTLKREYIIAFRKEVLQTILWGGDPNNAIQKEEDEKIYHPRNSFSIWKETIKNKSTPWNAPVLEAATYLKRSVDDILFIKGRVF